MPKIVPSLWFDKQCEEAVNTYINIFNGAPKKMGESRILSMKRYPDEPMPGLPMEGLEGKVLTVVFELDGNRFIALDGGPVFKPNEAISFLMELDTQEEVDYFWNKLSEGGDPNSQQCGWLKDKFGFSWQVTPKILGKLLEDPDKERADRAMQAMLKMKKLDIAELEKAANG